ncbi:MAG: TolC family protein [Candidatus Omnitrophota bacterium]
MRPFPKILVMSFLTTLSLGSAFAQDETALQEERRMEIEKALFMAAGSQERVLKIGLVDCIAYALKNNSEIKIKRIEPKLKEKEIQIAKAAFEPTLSVDYTVHDNTETSTSTLYPGTSKTNDSDFSAALSGTLPTGTEYDIEFLTERYKSSVSTQTPNPYYSAEPKITITQPLFRDFGALVKGADIIIAQNNKQSSVENFKDTVMETITSTKTAYYNYLYYLENDTLLRISLERAQNLWSINKARYEKGLISSVDLLETEAALVAREKALLSAEANLRKAEDDLKLITNLVDDPEAWNAALELIDANLEFKEEKADLLESLKNAFRHRPDYHAQKIDLKNRDIKITTAKNALFPTLDLKGSFGLNGLGSDYQEAIEKIDADDKDWSVGLTFSLPWGGEDRAKFDQRKLEKAQALIALKRLEQHIILEVRDKVRAVDIQRRQLEASKLSKEKEQKNYEAQKERYAAGEVSTHDMLDYQERLAQAELDEIKALIDYQTALIRLDQSEGLTLVKNDVTLEE